MRVPSLIVLAIEELSKVHSIYNALRLYKYGGKSDAWEEYWSAGGSHTKKQSAMLSYGRALRDYFTKSSEGSGDIYLFRIFPSEVVFGKLDQLKQSFFYVDIRTEEICYPKINDEILPLMDYLLSFLSERLDSYASWHCTYDRSYSLVSADDSTLLRNEFKTTFSPEEIKGDILYLATYFSAPTVNDYLSAASLAQDMIRVYKKNGVGPRDVLNAMQLLGDEFTNIRKLGPDFTRFNDRNFSNRKILISLAANILPEEEAAKFFKSQGLKFRAYKSAIIPSRAFD